MGSGTGEAGVEQSAGLSQGHVARNATLGMKALPGLLLSKDSAGLGQRPREGGEEPGWKCAQDPRRRGRGALQCGWSSSGRGVPPLPPSGAGPGISFPLQSWNSRGDPWGGGQGRQQQLRVSAGGVFQAT